EFMSTYNPDSPDSIRAIFDLEGDELNKAGFRQPADTIELTDETRPQTRAVRINTELLDLRLSILDEYAVKFPESTDMTHRNIWFAEQFRRAGLLPTPN